MPDASTPPIDPSDADLMAALARGDRSALAPLVERHQEKVFGLALRITGLANLSEDITQEVFLRVLRSADRYKPQAQFTTWLYRITYNRCMDHQRRRKFSAAPLDAQMVDPQSSDPSAPLNQQEQAHRVRCAIDRLPDRQRTALILFRYNDLTYKQIAETTGWSVSAVESLLVRAMANLKKYLIEEQKP